MDAKFLRFINDPDECNHKGWMIRALITIPTLQLEGKVRTLKSYSPGYADTLTITFASDDMEDIAGKLLTEFADWYIETFDPAIEPEMEWSKTLGVAGRVLETRNDLSFCDVQVLGFFD